MGDREAEQRRERHADDGADGELAEPARAA
jgi:hypothetical protein